MQKSLRRPVTLKDVAAAAGVSYQTVSRAINGFGEINAETSQRVLKIAAELGYRPNRLANSLRSAQSKALGLVVSDIENLFFAEVAAGVEAEATERGYSVLLANTSEDIHRERTAILNLFESRVDGLIVAPAEGDHDFLKTDLPETFPVVAINRSLSSPLYGAVLSENRKGAGAAVEYLVARGHTKIGAVVGSPNLMTSQERLEGFRSAMERLGLPIQRHWTAAGTIYPKGACEAAIEILQRSDRPTAIITSSQRITQGVLMALRHLGLRHGVDVELVGFDDFPWAALLDPPVAVIAQDTHNIGRKAVAMLLGMINGTGEAEMIRLPTRLVVPS
ncbi:LacI family DNA-binding transcriptional regulator [Xanthobacter sp. YC-JY1]|uniref:LacI family DNA-binding transcriptional regulator n=1 Tax=Xanthobacter sp. YC-JY1 TaxID=2419844 RepID=UPI001F341E2F|nr:LacI family DNA-binding transcriptional regulator [Xanthobacter sp. YC-JY1]UJX46308.1 LacI family transcriptional regulator [Xanthobacter sp. YC-JY1]